MVGGEGGEDLGSLDVSLRHSVIGRPWGSMIRKSSELEISLSGNWSYLLTPTLPALRDPAATPIIPISRTFPQSTGPSRSLCISSCLIRSLVPSRAAASTLFANLTKPPRFLDVAPF